MVACPGMEIAAGFACTVITESEHKFGSRKYFVRFQLIIRSIRIDSRDYAKVAYIVHFKSKLEIPCPSDSTQHHTSLCFLCRLLDTEFEERMRVHGGTASELGVDYFLAESQRLCTHLCLFRPVTAELSQIIFICGEIEHGGSITPQSDRLLFIMLYFTPCFDNVLFRISDIMQSHFNRILVVFQTDDCFRSACDCFLSGRYITEDGARIAITVCNGYGRFKVILCAGARIYFPTAGRYASVATAFHIRGEMVNVTFVQQLIAEISLIKASVRSHLKD